MPANSSHPPSRPPLGDIGEQPSLHLERQPPRRRPARSTYREPSREIPVRTEADVVVVGGGPAGTAAAVAAARMGADVLLIERYGHLGGLATGGLVIWIDRMTDWSGRQVIRGIADDLLGRLWKGAVFGPEPACWGSHDEAEVSYWSDRGAGFRGTVTWSPTVDPEALKCASLDLVGESGARLLLHSWVAMPIVEEGVVRGVVVENKEGRQAVLGRVVVDASGDGDVYARAGAAFETDVHPGSIHHCINVAWLWGGVDMDRWIRFKREDPEGLAQLRARAVETVGVFERPHVSWRNDVAVFMGPRLSGLSGLDADDLTRVEVESRRRMLQLLELYRRHAPGFENAWVLETAPQVGVRHTRRLVGVQPIVRDEWERGVVYEDEVGVSPSLSPAFPSVSIPLRSLLPERLEGLLAAGRTIASDAQSHIFLREIPQCWVTGQAAGVAAAVAASRGVLPRQVDAQEVRAELRRQGVFLQEVPVPT
ncbi:MAG TPA: FAD-dependent oxidoreductase [Candidatus Dormibacteraeota bacterium]|nr:FAD-dependent oxidoreductase [Candidatus Dormibacteraeota bacterium]